MAFFLEDVSVGYNGKPVLEHVSLAVESGQIVCLLGPNGVGKTTLFRSALGLMPLISGAAVIDGHNAAELDDRELARLVAYVPQAAEVPFAFTVLDVVVMGRLSRVGRLSSPGEADYAVARRVLSRLAMGDFAERSYTELSGGERQMVLIARAFAQEPRYVLMDEPCAALDLGNQARVLATVRSLARSGIGILMTTHAPDHVSALDATAALIMPDGSCLPGGPREILRADVLSRAFGVPVAVGDLTCGARDLRVCRPIIEEEQP